LKYQVYEVASALQALGIGHGDIVAVQLPNFPEFVVSWLAINACGAVMQTIHLPYGLREVEHCSATAAPRRRSRSALQRAARRPASCWHVAKQYHLYNRSFLSATCDCCRRFFGFERPKPGRNEAVADDPFYCSTPPALPAPGGLC
jgi:hypothetical protein